MHWLRYTITNEHEWKMTQVSIVSALDQLIDLQQLHKVKLVMECSTEELKAKVTSFLTLIVDLQVQVVGVDESCNEEQDTSVDIPCYCLFMPNTVRDLLKHTGSVKTLASYLPTTPDTIKHLMSQIQETTIDLTLSILAFEPNDSLHTIEQVPVIMKTIYELLLPVFDTLDNVWKDIHDKTGGNKSSLEAEQ